METVVERLLKYVTFHTTSEHDVEKIPSTDSQLVLAKELAAELKEIGLSDVTLDECGYVMATLPANCEGNPPVLGFIAHIDTSPDFTGKDVKPQIIKDYDGGDIVLNSEKGIVMSPKDFPKMANYKGQTLITTDGTTLLGGDNKAGIAEIITAMEYLIANPSIKHGTIKVAFTPDEEVGRGADKFDVEKFGADVAYTIDGSEIGELEYENFNGASAKLTINGTNIHPGTAKDKMVNSIHLAYELNSMLPLNQRPEYTTGYDGFFHLNDINGSVEKTELSYIIRDHDREKFEEKKRLISEASQYINSKYGEGRVVLELKDSYYNMKEKVEPHFYLIEIAKAAMESVGVEPIIKPIRGGTDGSRLSYMGLPTPNIFTGGHNFHGKYEYIPVESMLKAVEVIVEISKRFAELS